MTQLFSSGEVPVFFEPDPSLPLIHLSVTTLVGAASDPVGLEGLAGHAVELPLRGAGDRNREAFDEALDTLGATIDSQTFTDSVAYTGSCLTRNIEPLVELLSDMLTRPHLSQDEHDKLTRESLFELDDLLDDDAMIGTRFFSRDLCPGHPYSRAADGTRESLAAIDRDTAARAIAERCRRGNLVLGLAGDLDRDHAQRIAAGLLAGVPEAGTSARVPYPRERPAGKRTTVVDKPERSQTQIVIGLLAAAYSDPNFGALMVAENAFGGTFSSRLMQRVRVDRGWSYGAHCRFARSWSANYFRVELAPSPEVTGDAVSLVHDMIAELAADGISQTEFELARDNLLGSFALTRATSRIRMLQAVSGRVFDVADDFIDNLPAHLSSLTVDDVNAAIAATLTADDLLTVVVGTADDLIADLEKRDVGAITVAPHDSY